MSEQIEVAEIAEETFLGDLVSFVLEEMKYMPKQWALMSESEQGAVIERLDLRAKTIVKRAINILASQNRANVVAKIESITFKAGIKALLQVSPHAHFRHELADAEGQSVMIVIPNADEILENGQGMPEAEKDQPELGLDEDPLFDECLQTVRELGKVSISVVQRAMKIGYNRAANLVEQLQRAGWVTEADHNGVRELVVEKAA